MTRPGLQRAGDRGGDGVRDRLWLVEPSFVVAPLVRSARLVRVLGDVRISDIPISVVYTARRNLPRRVRAFVDFLVARFANPEWRKSALLA